MLSTRFTSSFSLSPSDSWPRIQIHSYYTWFTLFYLPHTDMTFRSKHTTHTHTLTHNGRAKICRDEEQLELKHDSRCPFLSQMKLECLSSNFHSSVWAMIALFTSSQIFRLPLSTCTLFTLSEAAVLQMHSVVWTEMTLTMWMERPDWDASDVFETASTWAKHQPCFNLLPGGFERFWK